MSDSPQALCSPAIVRPRVLINAASLWHGGSSRNYHRNLLSELGRDSRGFDFSVIAPSGELDAAELGSHELIEVRFPTRGRVALRVLWEQFLLPRRAASFDLLYCTSDLSPFWGPRGFRQPAGGGRAGLQPAHLGVDRRPLRRGRDDGHHRRSAGRTFARAG